MNDRAASRAVSKIATPKNDAASCGVFIIPRKRDKFIKTFLFSVFSVTSVDGFLLFSAMKT